jgi:hypothetical protein
MKDQNMAHYRPPIVHCKTGRKAGAKSGGFGKNFGNFFRGAGRKHETAARTAI